MSSKSAPLILSTSTSNLKQTNEIAAIVSIHACNALIYLHFMQMSMTTKQRRKHFMRMLMMTK